ncbi:uncharacterized protein G2W53_007917 [Senna tora]|uniref:Uncharacterized protein n=1 Tax=Senna tora TaxID=362788 RepID=A0A834X7J6_9FABA|nr:uncharacterized protein G2W53_007917 [Senna tora]
MKFFAIAKNIYSSAQQQPNDVDAQQVSENTQPPMYAHSQPPIYEHAQSSRATHSAGISSMRRSRVDRDMNKAWIVDVIVTAALSSKINCECLLGHIFFNLYEV